MSNFNFEEFIVNTPPYKTEKLDAEDVINISNSFDLRIETFCTKCGKRQAFVYQKPSSYLQDINGGLSYKMLHSPEEMKKHIQDEPELPIYRGLDFYCAKCKTMHLYIFITDRKTITKIGQFPSFGDLQGKEIDKYKNVLPKYFIEFKSSLNCYSQGKGIAAFVYLRRILEDLVEKKFEKLNIEKSGDENFVEKMKSVQEIEGIIPDELEDIRNSLYTVLSKGIHEYEEKECMELYPFVQFVITEILDKQLAEKARLEKIKNVKNTLIKKGQKNNG